MPEKRTAISALPVNTSPTLGDIFPIDNSGTTKQLSLGGLKALIASGTTGNVKFWLENETDVINSNETIVIKGNYILKNSNLTLNTTNTEIQIGNIKFDKYAQIFIDGYLLLIDSNITNNGQITVGNGIILSGNSTIIGSGIII